MNSQLFSAYLLITFVLVIVPGPIVTLVIATGASRGIRAALVTVAGTTLGNAVLLACIAFGLNWILKTSAEVFEIVRWIGAGYLVWLGVQAWRHAGKTLETPEPRHRVYVSRGFLVAMSNPKTIAFFTAFLPQFVDPGLPAEHQLVVMCLVAVLMAAHGCVLGGRRRGRPRIFPEAVTGPVTWPIVRRGIGRRRRLAFVGTARQLAGARCLEDFDHL